LGFRPTHHWELHSSQHSPRPIAVFKGREGRGGKMVWEWRDREERGSLERS